VAQGKDKAKTKPASDSPGADKIIDAAGDKAQKAAQWKAKRQPVQVPHPPPPRWSRGLHTAGRARD
jgi:hypothetical protein